MSNKKLKAKVRRTWYTMIHHGTETYDERIARMEYLFQQYLEVKDKIYKHTIDDLDALLKERFLATEFIPPLPLSQFDDYGLSSLGEEEFITEEDIVKIYQINDAKIIETLSEKEKKSIGYQEELSEDDVIKLYQITDAKAIGALLSIDKKVKYSFYGESLSEEGKRTSFYDYYEGMLEQEKNAMFSENYKNMSMEEKYAIYDKHLKDELKIKNIYIIYESKDGKYISGGTMQGGSFTELDAVLLIAEYGPVPEAEWDIEDSWFQQYLEALVWAGWIRMDDVSEVISRFDGALESEEQLSPVEALLVDELSEENIKVKSVTIALDQIIVDISVEDANGEEVLATMKFAPGDSYITFFISGYNDEGIWSKRELILDLTDVDDYMGEDGKLTDLNIKDVETGEVFEYCSEYEELVGSVTTTFTMTSVGMIGSLTALTWLLHRGTVVIMGDNV